ncbi:uncharacterized protein LOC124162302 isoform X2 [Ischnura elegans]|nr:uncharacterized protein LOC124162302 isoform X2 [Ischnura elegans]XP_046394746.1 uncharacterized protein LOC124162302 isoform X2 [Ischnura elegans]
MQKWADAVARQDRPLRPSDCICEKHFKEEDVIRFWRAFDRNGGEVMKVAYKRVRLRSGAVPCYFPTSDSGFSRKKRRLPVKNDLKLKKPRKKSDERKLKVIESHRVESDSVDDEDFTLNLTDGEEVVEGFDPLYDSCDDSEDKCSNSPEVRQRCDDIVKRGDALTIARLFEDMWSDSKILSLPSKSWAMFRLETNGKRKVVISQMGFMDDGTPSPVKQVCLDEEMNVELYLKGTKLHCEEMNINLPKMCTVSDVSSFILSVDGLQDWD